MRTNEVACTLCGSSEYNLLFHDKNRRDNIICVGTYVQCKKCTLVYLLYQPTWEEIAKFYSSLDKEHTANSGLTNVEKLDELAEKTVSIWKHILFLIISLTFHVCFLKVVVREST